HRHTCPGLLLRLGEFVTGLVPGPSIDDDALKGAGCGASKERTGPVAVLALVDRTITVDLAPLAAWWLCRSCWHLTRFLVIAFECSYVLAQGIGGDEAELAVLDGADPVGPDQPVEDCLADAEHRSGLAGPVEQLVHGALVPSGAVHPGLLSCELVVLTGPRGGGEGELAFGGGGMAGSGVPPGGHQQDGAFVEVAAPGVFLAVGVPLLAAVGNAGLAQGGEGGRVTAGLGQEM